ncbi:hypothetical protein KOI35_46055 [Actinoplanes bogorensis]|uniref:Uncharacterized protein n=1 Tax=Paractinoplanes bogorensis TaxID=1610840 RepID=A0ABS5Z5G9_9ACTN|nr:hypothetical protein [Actinoplanes bogorensis]MBU2670888.1 hypothetical protein [Actinoplanes bogorensis]
MEIYTMSLTKASMPLTRACAPSASLIAAPVWAPATVERAPFEATTAPITVPVLAAERAPASQVHQVSARAELGGALELLQVKGSTGFKGINVSAKRYTDGSGVPPRGRPV